MPIDGTIECPICGGMLRTMFDGKQGLTSRVDCYNCGEHWLDLMAIQGVDRVLHDHAVRARVAHTIVKMPTSQRISTDLLIALRDKATLPPPLERIDNLIAYLADNVPAGSPKALANLHLRARLGCESKDAAEWVIRQAEAEGFIQAVGTFGHVLTVRGYRRHDELKRDGKGSRHAFMAMDFKQADIRALFEQHLIDGVRRTDFELRTTEHSQKTAGLIDARMRVELHTSRFVVCDLTHNNRGAYWEAGFAEGIGRPVFYLCRADVLESQDPESKPHFDIAHQAIVKWDPANPGLAVDELVAMIRATLPHEATMEDPAV